ncbi:MAG TPA: aerial mycelium formation protein [Motilibacteraceae bacterium]|nr:aerial mycelium formation protein [Motilibacteraceae bacterium]
MSSDSAQASTDPMPGGRRRIDRVLGAGFLDGLGELPLEELRARRRDAEQEEADLSYVRRMLQGRADLLRAELDRRSGAAPDAAAAPARTAAAEAVAASHGGDDADLVARLTAALTDPAGRSDHGLGRFLTVEPSRVDEHRRSVEQLIADVGVSDAGAQTEDDLRAALARVEEVERGVSGTRRKVQDVMDALTAEVGRRYQDGRARVEDLLPEG